MNNLFDTQSFPHPSQHLNPSEVVPCQRELRIVHVVSSMLVGGMEQFVLRLSEAQKRRGHYASVIALRGGPLLETARQHGVQVNVLGGSWSLSRVIRGIAALARLRPDIIHAHNPTSLHYAILGKFVGRPRVVMTDHAQAKIIQRLASRREQRLTDAVVAVSQDTAEKASVRGRLIPLSVIHNGIDLTPIISDRNRIRKKMGLQGACVGIIVARLEKVKRHEDLLQAMAMLQGEASPITMLIVGDGPERKNLETVWANQTNRSSVQFLGFRSDVMNLLAASDFFVLSSEMEGLPLAMLEAMKQRLPVIATSVGGIPEVINHNQTGLLTPVNDPTALARAIRQVAQDTDLRSRLGLAGYQRVCADFDFTKMTDKYIDLYYRVKAKYKM